MITDREGKRRAKERQRQRGGLVKEKWRRVKKGEREEEERKRPIQTDYECHSDPYSESEGQ